MKITAQALFYKRIEKEKVHNNILEIIPTFDGLPKEKKYFIINQYLKSYDYGIRTVKENIFTDSKLLTYQELSDRFNNFPKIENKEIDFVKKLAEEDHTSLTTILDKTANQEDFVYECYEGNFIDKSMDVLHTMTTPKGYEEIDLYLVSQDGFSYGCMRKIDYLAKKSMSKWAAKMFEEL